MQSSTATGHTSTYQAPLNCPPQAAVKEISHSREGQRGAMSSPPSSFPRGGTPRLCVRLLHKRLQTVTSNDSSTCCYSFTLVRNEHIFSFFPSALLQFITFYQVTVDFESAKLHNWSCGKPEIQATSNTRSTHYLLQLVI